MIYLQARHHPLLVRGVIFALFFGMGSMCAFSQNLQVTAPASGTIVNP